MESIQGIHHVTAVADDAQEIHDFHAGVLGLRFVKRGVNQDEPHRYHLFYGDRRGRAGTSITFFPVGGSPGETGAGMASTVGYAVPEGSLGWWRDRFAARGVDHGEPFDRAGDRVQPFATPDGLACELVATAVPDGDPWLDGGVPAERAIRGFHGVTLAQTERGPTADLLETMGFAAAGEPEPGRYRYEAPGDLGAVVDLDVDPERAPGRGGVGTVHHVAFRVPDVEALEDWRVALSGEGLRPTRVIDRKYFHSVYVREPGGVLFEFASMEPGYTVDEPLDALGATLSLPERLEDRREEIEAMLPPFEV
jgi:glyoxalase family protein